MSRTAKKPGDAFKSLKISSSINETRQEETVETILRSFGCRAAARDPQSK
jgi:hypothetical protein